MSKKRPYFNLNQIITGKYTKGGEYYTDDGTVYIGPYHELPTGQKFTEFIPTESSIELYPITGAFFSNKTYRKLTPIKLENYIVPTFYLPIVTDDDFNNGYFKRFFVQKRADPISTIVEIDSEQYASVNLINGPGIDGHIWRKYSFDWKIRGEVSSIIQINQNTLNSVNIYFPGILTYIKNLLEFVR